MVIIYLLLGYLLTVFPIDTSALCENSSLCNGKTCPKDEVNITSNPSSPQEGDDVTLTCNVKCENSNVTFQWKKDGNEEKGEKNRTLLIPNVLAPSVYICSVSTSHNCYCDSEPYELSISSNTVIILVICGIGALALVLIMGLIMKCKLKRDNDKHRERMRQRVQAGQAAGPQPISPR